MFPKNDHPIPLEEGSPLCPTSADPEQDPPLVALLDSMGPLEDVPLVDCGPLCFDPAVLSTPNDTVEFSKSATEVMIDLLKLTSDTPTGAQGVEDVLLSEKEVALPLSFTRYPTQPLATSSPQRYSVFSKKSLILIHVGAQFCQTWNANDIATISFAIHFTSCLKVHMPLANLWSSFL